MLLAAWLGAAPAMAEDIDPAVAEIQHRWEVIQYQTTKEERRAGFETLAEKASALAAAKADRPDALIWEGIVLSSLAGEKQGLDKLSALGLIKRARDRYETAIRIDAGALNGNEATISITATWGWAAIPARIEQAALIVAKEIITNRDEVKLGLVGFSDVGGVTARTNPIVRDTIAAYKRVEAFGIA